ncbi:MAG: hypothetical protein KDI68_09070 [Gammaproteobacteria bacterium]|nr:hypothetical protein [Gammaproteobacteria bacterium]
MEVTEYSRISIVQESVTLVQKGLGWNEFPQLYDSNAQREQVLYQLR